MSVGFGFSVGDFIAALELVADVVDALRESGEANRRYRELVRQLDSLESVLLRVKRLELDQIQHGEYIALQQAASACQRTIDEFWNKIKKYQPTLGFGETSRLKQNWMKIRWAVCKKEDVIAFKADIAAHTESIQLLLVSIQITRMNLLEKKSECRNVSLTSKLQTGYFEIMKKISAVFEATSNGIEQGKQLISTTSKILQMNVQIFQTVLSLHNFITRIPAQVDRQQPVYLTDALGRQSPFHLEFIRSAEALTAVLQANFSKTGKARKKIGRGEFAIQDSLKKHDIDIYGDWDKCFYPGQRVEMSVVFQRRWQSGSSCPGCSIICDGSTNADIECWNCGMTFRRIIEIEGDISSKSQVDKPPHGPSNKPKSPTRNQEISPGPAVQLQQLSGSTPEENKQQVAINRKRKREYARDNELDLDLHLENIRRVRIRTVSRGVTERFEVLFGFFEENGKPEPAFCYGFRTEDDESCLIIEFEDNNNGALCDTIDQQAFKLGGLFETELVKAESIIEDAEECDRQITWMEEDEVQMYLRFKSQKDREFIWKFIISAWSRSIMRQGHRYQPVPGQHITETETYSENPKPHALTPLPVSQTCSEPGCSRQFRRPYDLKKHEKSHTRPWKCPVKACYYHEYGWSTEKEMERHHDDKHGDAPAFYECLFKPCPYRSKRESNCKQHMEKAHGWTYVRSKSNGKSKDKAGQAGEASPDPLPVPQNTNASDYNEISSISIQSSTADTDSFGYPSNLNSDMFTTPLVDTTWAPSLPEWLHDFHNNTPSYDVADNTFDWPSYPDFGFNNAEFSFFGENEDPQQGPLPDTIEKSQNLLPEVKDLDSVEENKNIPKDIKQSPRRDTHDLYPSWPQDTISQRDGLFSFEDIPTPLLQPNSYQQGGPYSLFEDPKRGAIREIITQSDSHSWSKNTQHGVYRELTSQSGSGDTGARKRALNTLAARISRQRKMQQFNELEEKIVKLEKERDHWRSVADESLGETHTMQVVEPVSMTDMQKVDIEIHQDAMQVDERGP